MTTTSAGVTPKLLGRTAVERGDVLDDLLDERAVPLRGAVLQGGPGGGRVGQRSATAAATGPAGSDAPSTSPAARLIRCGLLERPVP